MFELEAEKLVNHMKKLIQESVSKNDTMTIGTVKRLNPLTIEIYDKIELSGKHLFLGQMCRPYKVTIPHTHKYSGKTEKAKATASPDIPPIIPPTPIGDLTIVGQVTVQEPTGHSHEIKDQETDDVHEKGCGTDFEKSVTIEIEPKLKEGDKVLMFAFNNYQTFYVAERLEETK